MHIQILNFHACAGLRQARLQQYYKEKYMKLVIVGQQDFGKAALEAFLNRGDEVVGVFCAPEKEGGRPDPLRVFAQEKGLNVKQFPALTDPAAQEELKRLNADIGVMAYVTQFAPQEFCNIPKFGMIQFHPSLLPLHRGASAMSWSIVTGKKETGFAIFRPTDGLDEGPVILMKAVPIEEDDTLGDVYFGKIFPMGVAGLVEAAELVVSGMGAAVVQYEPAAGYEGIIRAAESKINWANHVDITYNLIRGLNPAPGAWTSLDGKKLFIYDARKVHAQRFEQVRGKKIGQVVGETADGLLVHGQGGFIEVRRVKWEDGKKVAAKEAGLAIGTILGS